MDVETEFIVKNLNDLDDYLYDPDSAYVKITNAKQFDSIDIIFIAGS